VEYIPARHGSEPGKRNMFTHQKHVVGEKPFACSYCSKRFTTLHRVTKHEKTHSDYDQDEEASYACSVCDRSFRWDTLAAHERTHHVHKKKPKVTVAQGHANQHEQTRQKESTSGSRGGTITTIPSSSSAAKVKTSSPWSGDGCGGGGTLDERNPA